MGGNMILGGISIGIGNLVNLTPLDLQDIYLGGPLSHAFGKL